MTEVIALLKALVAINSVNPDLVRGAEGEATIAEFCATFLRDRGFDVTRLEETPGRPSIVGRFKGRGGGKSLMFNGHVDTVSFSGYCGNPLAPRIVDDRLFGRGAFDMKSGVAAMLSAAAQASQRGLAGDILVACVADEEYASRGTAEVLRQFSADAAIVTEPSHLEVTLSHKGFVWFDICVIGRAAHGSQPEQGIDAIAKSGHFLVALESLGARLQHNPSHPILRSGSIHASLIAGGQELSSYPAECRIGVERRTVPHETADAVEAELRQILSDLSCTVPDFAFELKRQLVRQPFEADPNAAIVTTLLKSATRVLGHVPNIRGEPFWTDCALFQEANIPCLMFGADGGGAHAAREWTSVASVRQLTDILVATACEFCA
jgi:acetylornithine deacetylase